MALKNIREKIREKFSLLEEKVREDNYLFVVIEAERLGDFISFAKEKLQFEHLSSISAYGARSISLWLYFLFWGG